MVASLYHLRYGAEQQRLSPGELLALQDLLPGNHLLRRLDEGLDLELTIGEAHYLLTGLRSRDAKMLRTDQFPRSVLQQDLGTTSEKELVDSLIEFLEGCLSTT